jgi:Kef-type K+ transport system membrane component KefB/nucleotide-binding universal stress UspA family protein
MGAALIHDPLTRFFAQAVAIVVASRVLGLLLKRIGQPQVIAEVIAGIVLGPSLLGAIAPGALDTLFAKQSLGPLQLLSQVGLVLFMFLIGLELDPSLLRGRGKTSVWISQAGIAVPFGLGVLLAFGLRSELSSDDVPFPAFALFMGVAMAVTAFPVLARILSEGNLLGTRVGATAIACAAVDDIAAWCLLAFVVSVARSTGIGGALITTVLALGYIAVMWFVVRPVLARLGARVGDRAGLTQNLVATVILLLLISSWATELVGIHALFGAFLLGVVLPKEGNLARALADKLEDLVLVLFLPLFFAFSGLRTQIGLLETARDWLFCGGIIGVACLGKFGGVTLAGRISGLPWRESSALGILMNTRGLVELVVLNIGLDLGVIGSKLFTMLVLMALVTTFMTTPLLDRVYPKHLRVPASGVRLETPLPARLQPRFDILICVSHARSGPGLVTLANALSGKERVRVHALHLVNPTDRASFYVEGSRGAEHEPALIPLVERARALDTDVRPITFVSSDPAEGIQSVAEKKHAELILIGWHKPVFSQTLLGGTVYRILRDAPANVGVFVDRGLERVRRVLVPFVGSVHDRAAVALARRILGSGSDVEVTLLHVRAPEPGTEAGQRDSDEIIDEPDGGRVVVRVVHDLSPVGAALAEMERGYDLVVVGASREWGLEQRLLGVQRERLMLESKVSLLVVRGRPSPEAEALELSSSPA